MSLFIPALTPALDGNGNPISGATWSFYATETLDPESVYADSELESELGAVVTANASGKFAPIFLDDDVTYRAVLKNAGGTTIDDVDPYSLSLRNELPIYVEHYGAVGDGVTDDTAAIQAAIDAVLDAGGGRLHLLYKTYSVTKLTIPAINGGDGEGWRVIELVGHAQPSPTMGTIDVGYPLSTKGTIIKSVATGDAILRALPFGGSFSGVHVVLRDLHFRSYDNPNIDAIQMRFAQQLTAENIVVDTGVWSTAATQPTHLSYGLRPPEINNGALNYIRNIAVSGYYVGLEVTEHCRYEYANVFSCLYGLEYGAATHSSLISEVGLYRCRNNILVSSPHRGEIQQVRIEHTAVGWQALQYDVVDTLNRADLEIAWSVVEGNVGQSRIFKKNGGSGVHARRVGEMQPALAQFFRSTSQSIANATETSITWDLEGLFECALINPGDATQIIVFETGTYDIDVSIPVAANATGYRRARLFAGAAVLAVDSRPGHSDITTLHLKSGPVVLTAPDNGVVDPAVNGTRLVTQVYQNSGGSLDVTPGAFEGPCRITLKKLRG